MEVDHVVSCAASGEIGDHILAEDRIEREGVRAGSADKEIVAGVLISLSAALVPINAKPLLGSHCLPCLSRPL